MDKKKTNKILLVILIMLIAAIVVVVVQKNRTKEAEDNRPGDIATEDESVLEQNKRIEFTAELGEKSISIPSLDGTICEHTDYGDPNRIHADYYSEDDDPNAEARIELATIDALRKPTDVPESALGGEHTLATWFEEAKAEYEFAEKDPDITIEFLTRDNVQAVYYEEKVDLVDIDGAVRMVITFPALDENGNIVMFEGEAYCMDPSYYEELKNCLLNFR